MVHELRVPYDQALAHCRDHPAHQMRTYEDWKKVVPWLSDIDRSRLAAAVVAAPDEGRPDREDFRYFISCHHVNFKRGVRTARHALFSGWGVNS